MVLKQENYYAGNQKPEAPPGQWTSGLFDCFDDVPECVLTWCCPCITFGRNAEIIDRGTTSCALAGVLCSAFGYFGLSPCYTCTYRTKLRGLYSLPEDPCMDFGVHCCCSCCALSQESRELKNRGFDPSIGWVANAERMNRAGNGTPATPPAFAPGMVR